MNQNFNFDELIDKNLFLDLFAEVELEFYGIDVTDKVINDFILSEKKQLSTIVERLNNGEKRIFFDKAYNDFQGNSGGFRQFWINRQLEEMDFEEVITQYPLFKMAHVEFDNPELKLFEDKYSLYKYFEQVKNELITFLEAIDTGVVSKPANSNKINQQNLDKKREQVQEKYALNIASYSKLLIKGIEVAMISSIDPIALMKSETAVIEEVLINGVVNELGLSINHWSKSFKIDPKTIKSIYNKLVQGLELDMLEEFTDEGNVLMLQNLAKCQALIHYKEVLVSKIEDLVKSEELKDRQLTKSRLRMLNSRYSKPFNIFINKIDSDNLFKKVFNEDKGTYHLPYLYHGYTNELLAFPSSQKIFSSVTQYLDDNLFKKSEKRLLISELLPLVQDFGSRPLLWMLPRSANDDEQRKSAETLLEIRQLLIRQFNFYLSSLKKKQRKTPFSGSKGYPSIFERELKDIDFPFIDIIIKEPFKSALYKEFSEAPTKPSLTLFTRQFYSDDEIKKGITEAHSKIKRSSSKGPVMANCYLPTPFESHLNEISADFYNQISKDVLKVEFYCPDIRKTPFYEKLKEAEDTFQILQNSVLDKSSDLYKEAEIRADSIIHTLNKLSDKQIVIAVSELLISSNDHFKLFLIGNDELTTKWKAVKNHFNLLLSKELELLERTCHSASKNVVSADSEPVSLKQKNKNLTKHDFSYPIMSPTVNKIAEELTAKLENYINADTHFTQSNFDKSNKDVLSPIEDQDLPLDNEITEIRAIVEDYMEQFSEEEILSDSDYEKTLNLFTSYFLSKTYVSGKCIVLKKRVNKRFALECGKLFREACPSKPITYEYLIFLKTCFLPFESEIIEKEKFQRAKLYKYLTAKK